MRRFLFFSHYAFRSFRRSGGRAVFATFCVAAGVAAIVALQLVSANLRASITGNAQKTNRGDVSVTAPLGGMPLKVYQRFATLERQRAFLGYTPLIDTMTAIRPVGADRTKVTFAMVNGIDPIKYPFYDRIATTTPADMPLATVLGSPRDIVVNQAVFDKLGLHIGSKVTVAIRAHSYTYTVTGIVPATALTITGNPFGLSFFGMVDYRRIQPAVLSLGSAANRIYIRTRDAAQAARVKDTLQASLGNLYTINTAADVEKQNKDAANNLDKFLTIMGLLALLIGGIGIINTMLVAARRRFKEIAILKALGMKSGEVVGTFALGTIVLGLAGGVVGVIVGIAMSLVVNQVTQSIMPTTVLVWQLRPGPIISGMIVALVGTVLFGVLPVYRESQVKPIAALRDEQAHAYKSLTSRAVILLRDGALTVALAMVMGVLAAFFVDFGSPSTNVVVGLTLGLGVLVVFGLLTEIFSWVILGVSKLPGLGNLTLRLTFRNLERQRRRMASTLLALCVGILAIGSIAIMAQNLKSEIGAAAASQNSFNVIVFYGLKASDQAKLYRVVDRLPGVTTREYAGFAGHAKLFAVDYLPASTLLTAAIASGAGTDEQTASWQTTGITGRDVRAGALTTPLAYGMPLGPRDAGTNHAMVGAELAKVFGIHVGSLLEYRMDGKLLTFQVTAVAKPLTLNLGLSGLTVDTGYLQKVGALNPADVENYSTTYLNVQSAYTGRDVDTLNRSLTGVQVLDLSVITDFFNQWIDKFALFPEILAGLSLFAGAVIIANTVAMSMMERRREIAIMKAVGARRRLVLRELLTENAVVGLLGAVAGTALAVLATVVVDNQVLYISAGFDWLVIAALLALGTVLAMAAAFVTAWPASGEKPLTVLRYE
jgi:predicted lysophospholipase L1 biosynthesis ABC-type transport system permease subunit